MDFLNSIADKAQSAVNSSPLAGYIPGYQPDPTKHSAQNAAASKSHALESIQHQFRSLQQQYSYGLAQLM